MQYLKACVFFAGLAACEQFRSNEYQYLGKEQVPAILNKWEEYTKETIRWAEKINDNELLGFQYWNWANIYERRKDNIAGVNYNKKAIYYFHLAGSEAWEAQVCTLLCSSHATKGEIDTEGFSYCQRSLELTQKLIKKSTQVNEYDKFFVQLSFINMSDLYKAAGDYEMALNILHDGQKYHIPGSKVTTDLAAEKGKIFQLLGNYDSSLYYLKSFESKNQNRFLNEIVKGQMYLSETYALTKQYDKALPLIKECIDSVAKLTWAKKNYSYP